MALLLTPEKLQNEKIINEVALLVQLLEAAEYEKFWEVINPLLTSYETIVGSIQGKVRNLIMDRIVRSHSCIKVEKVCHMLDIKAEDVSKYLTDECTVDGALIKLKKVNENTLKPIEVEKISHLKLKNVWPLIKKQV